MLPRARAKRPWREGDLFHIVWKVSAHPYVFMAWTATNLPLPLTHASATVQLCNCASDRPLSVLSEYPVPKQKAIRSQIEK